jgi:Phage related hypothetical protein (DUF1799)
VLAAGLTLADLESEAVTYWPDNATAVHLFCRIGTQWRVGAGGCTGLDYCAVYPLMDRLQLDPMDWDLLLDDIRTLENAALVAMNEKD